jgi:hypothetical protein
MSVMNFSYTSLQFSRLLSRNLKIKMYKTKIFHVIFMGVKLGLPH